MGGNLRRRSKYRAQHCLLGSLPGVLRSQAAYYPIPAPPFWWQPSEPHSTSYSGSTLGPYPVGPWLGAAPFIWASESRPRLSSLG